MPIPASSPPSLCKQTKHSTERMTGERSRATGDLRANPVDRPSKSQSLSRPKLYELIYLWFWENKNQQVGSYWISYIDAHNCCISTRLHRGSNFYSNIATMAIKFAFNTVSTEVKWARTFSTKMRLSDPLLKGSWVHNTWCSHGQPQSDQSNYATRTWFLQVWESGIVSCTLQNPKVYLALTWHTWKGS